MNNLGANRNSTPEASSSSLRPPNAARGAIGAGHQFRASADMGGLAHGSDASRSIRPASEVYFNRHNQAQSQSGPDDNMDKAAQEWIADIDQFQTTLEEMAAATLDQDFKDELGAIEQWFRVLSEAERTAALYALLQQTTQVQTRFFIGILQQMAKSHPLSSVLSPSNFDRDPMSSRLSSAMNRLSVEGSRASANMGRPPMSPSMNRNSGLNEAEINSMFPDAVAAIQKQRAEFTEKTGNEPRSNRSSALVGNRISLNAPTISAPPDEPRGRTQPSSWNPRGTDPHNTSQQPPPGTQPMGQFSQPPASAGLRGGRAAPISSDNNVQNTSIDAPQPTPGLGSMSNILSPYTGSGNWASMVSTPMVANFQGQDQSNQANMVANATAMKLAAIPTLNGRVQLDDARKFRRSRSTEGQAPPSPGLLGSNMSNVAMTNEYGQLLSPQQAASLQAQQLALQQGRRSRPSSPGLTVPGQGPSSMNLAGATNNGLLTAFDPNQQNLLNSMNNLGLGSYGAGGPMHDPSEINRGRSPRGKRGTSRPPEDPTDPGLLSDIPAWLRSLRLHKYTDNLKDLPWQQLIEMDDAALEQRGVAAVGARRKMLKTFEEVKAAKTSGKLP